MEEKIGDVEVRVVETCDACGDEILENEHDLYLNFSPKNDERFYHICESCANEKTAMELFTTLR